MTCKLRRAVKGICMVVLIMVTLSGCVNVPFRSSAEPEPVPEYVDQIDIDNESVFTDNDLANMSEVDKRIGAVIRTRKYDKSDSSSKGKMVRSILYELRDEGLIDGITSSNGMVGYTHKCGVLGGVQLEDFDSRMN